MERSFFECAWDVVRQVPAGRVASYGQVARLMGAPRCARQVGYAMHGSPSMAGGVPCHRVVFSDGSLAPGFAFGGPDEQRRMLEAEGVRFRADGRVDMARSQWEA
ncbi:MGMT family protein [Thermophilibacter provencensis]|uniref:MGMT family protein n=1 Tax=Thermophilibacter provencensis TaxID=1852386 RepID=A0A921GEQ3_9ACTN|nr:MGMT family protein [Thermophilibacter provencensis]HJF44479.1 MGMT family protein [Thermophilibacter provencensis]